METKTCSKCKQCLSVSSFHFRNKKEGKRSGHCKKCQNAYTKAHYAKNKEYYKKKARARDGFLREYVWDLKSNPCVDCKGTFHPCQMDFDHLEDKLECISTILSKKWSKARLDEEISKCDLVCANCHRLRTWTRTQNKPL